MKLDSLVVRGLIKSLDLVKIDVEGAELMVSRGATSTITNFKPILSIDVNHYLGEENMKKLSFLVALIILVHLYTDMLMNYVQLFAITKLKQI